MSMKRADDWTSHLGGSQLPDDDLTFTDAANGLLDGFSFDTQPNEGVLDHARLPSVKGLSGLPDGLMAADDDVQIGFGVDIELNDEVDGMDLDNMLSFDEGGEDISFEVSKAASLVNLDWLDPTQKQDPDRLPMELRPDQPPLNSVPALEAAWGSNEPTTGTLRIPARDLRTVVYEESIKEDQSSNLPGQAKTADEKQDAILHAVRVNHLGQDIRTTLSQLKLALGDTPIGRQVAASLKDDYGLAGKVFIRASAFPGIKNGKWVKVLMKAARTAKYVITDDQMVADRLQMKMVANVPWGSALREFAPWLHATGHKLASGDPKEVLRRAFLAGPVAQAPSETLFPEQHPVVASEVEARDEMDRVAAVPATVVKTPEQVAIERKRTAALIRIAGLVKASRLSPSDAIRLRKFSDEGVPSHRVLQAAELLVGAVKEAGTYEGLGADLPKDAQLARLRVWANLDEAKAQIQTGESNKVAAYLKKAVKAGLLTSDEAMKIWTTPLKPREMRRVAETAVAMAGKMRPERLVAMVETHDYSGAANENDRPMTAVDIRAKTAAEEAAHKHQVQVRLAKWVQGGLISAGAARAIWASGKTASEMEAAGTLIVSERREASQAMKDANEASAAISGKTAVQASEARTFIGPHYTEYAQGDRVTKRADVSIQETKLEEARKKKATAHLSKLVDQKLITAEDAEQILKTATTAQGMEEEATRIISTAKTGEYKGRIEKAAVMERRFAAPIDPTLDRIMKVAKESGIKVAEFQGMLRWTRQQMSEGMVGADLNSLMRAKFASTMLKAGKDLIREIRAEHEGLSGHLYVDAAAYASQSGIAGCERGGLRHRGNTLKAVLAMSRCASCTNKNADGFCSVYNKRLADAAPVEDTKEYQKEAIRLSDAHDSEITASLFNPGEFNLQSPLDNLTMASEVTNEQLGDVLFGGTEL